MYNNDNVMSFYTWFKFPRYEAAHPFCGDRWENHWRSVFQVTISIDSVTKVGTVYAGNAETTAFIAGTGYPVNVVAKKIAIHSPFDVTRAVFPI
jgi:hypothetical protein